MIPLLSPTVTRGNNRECVQLRTVMRCVRAFVKRCCATSVSLFWVKILRVTAVRMPSPKDFLKNLVRSGDVTRHWRERVFTGGVFGAPLGGLKPTPRLLTTN